MYYDISKFYFPVYLELFFCYFVTLLHRFGKCFHSRFNQARKVFQNQQEDGTNHRYGWITHLETQKQFYKAKMKKRNRESSYHYCDGIWSDFSRVCTHGRESKM